MEKIEKNQIVKRDYGIYFEIITVCLCVLAALVVIWSFNGEWPWKAQPYNSYILQAQSWLSGRLDLDNRAYLELAIYNNKYYVSFPPFPSYLMLPFVAMGWNSCDSMIALAASMAGAVYAYLILKHFDIDKNRALLFSLFVTIGSNWLMTATNAYVWFIAQNMAFALTLMAVYYALKGKAGLSLSFWACAVGCRPFQILYIPVLLYLIYKSYKTNGERSIPDMIKKHWKCCIAPFLIAVSYMILNFARFGSIAEFGHNYLPEFMRVKEGQFHIHYLAENLKNLIRLPALKEGGAWDYPAANGMCLFMVSPIFAVYLVYFVKSFIKRENTDKPLLIIALALLVTELLVIAAHKTMGGAHFGNRYTTDALPFAFVSLAMLLPKEKGKSENIILPLFIFGLSLNMIGVATYYM